MLCLISPGGGTGSKFDAGVFLDASFYKSTRKLDGPALKRGLNYEKQLRPVRATPY